MRTNPSVPIMVMAVALLAAPSLVGAAPTPPKAQEGGATKAEPAKAAPTKAEPAKAEGGPHLVPGKEGGLPEAAAGKRTVVREGRQGMGTFMEILVATDKKEEAQKAIAEAFHEMSRIESLMSEWMPESEVSQINKAAGGQPVTISEELLKVLEQARKVSELSHGAFDVTWAALEGLWKFDGSSPKIPSDEEIASRLKLVGYADLVLTKSPPTAKLAKKGMAIGLGGIAKGYAVDRAAAILRKHGFIDFIVYAGGDLYTSGHKGPGRPWTIGVQHPRVRGALISTFPAPGGAVVTSGDYERYFIKDGVRYHHIIDLRNGKPARKSIAVTVMAKDAVMADALSTAVFVLGPKDGLELVEKLPGVEAIVIDPQGKPWLSSGLKDEIDVQTVQITGP